MSSSIRVPSGANGAPDRPARRERYPDASPEVIFGRPPLHLQSAHREVMIEGESWGLEPARREPGDEASELYRLTRIPDGTTHRIGLTRFSDRTLAIDCDCAEHRASGIDCVHSRTLRLKRVFRTAAPRNPGRFRFGLVGEGVA